MLSRLSLVVAAAHGDAGTVQLLLKVNADTQTFLTAYEPEMRAHLTWLRTSAPPASSSTAGIGCAGFRRSLVDMAKERLGFRSPRPKQFRYLHSQ